MINRDYILKELTELNSSLGTVSSQNVYAIPEGYFEGLAAKVMSRIKAIEAKNATDELAHLSPFLSGLSKKIPYTVPGDYFDSVQKNSQFPVTETDKLSAKDELEMLSPMLSNMSKEIPFTVPQGYFETLTDNFRAETKKPATKVVSLFKESWFRYAAAAVVTGVVILAGFLIIGRTGGDDTYGTSLVKLEKTIKKDIKKTSDKELNDFLQQISDIDLTGDEIALNDKVPDTEIRELLKDIPETELKEFLNETTEADVTTDESTLTN